MNQKWYHKEAVRADEIKVVGPEGRQCYLLDSDPKGEPLTPAMEFGDTLEVGDFVILQKDPDFLVPTDVCIHKPRKEFLKYYSRKA